MFREKRSCDSRVARDANDRSVRAWWRRNDRSDGPRRERSLMPGDARRTGRHCPERDHAVRAEDRSEQGHPPAWSVLACREGRPAPGAPGGGAFRPSGYSGPPTRSVGTQNSRRWPSRRVCCPNWFRRKRFGAGFRLPLLFDLLAIHDHRQVSPLLVLVQSSMAPTRSRPTTIPPSEMVMCTGAPNGAPIASLVSSRENR